VSKSHTGTLSADEIRLAIRHERLDLASVVAEFDDEAWDRSSLCAGWRVRDVVAHLSLSTVGSWPQMLIGMLRFRGDFEKMSAVEARQLADRTTNSDLVELLRATADSTRHSPGSSPLDQLLDLLVHGQDIARPLAIERAVPTLPGIAALEHALASRWYGAKPRVAGLRLEATDVEWMFGDGPNVSAPLADLLLISTGRRHGLERATGGGVETLSARMSSSN